MPQPKLNTFVTRWNRRDEFFQALLTRLCEDMTMSLQNNTPGSKLPMEWNFDVSASSGGFLARIWNQRLDDNPEFERIFFYLDLGTQDHWVAPVNALALHWVEDGIHYFSKGHMVSGIQASNFHAKATIVLLKYRATLSKKWSTFMSTGRLP